MPGPARARLTTAARYLLAVLPLIWIFGRMDLGLFFQACGQAAPWVIPFAVVSQYLIMFMQAVRWWLTQRPFAPSLTLRTSVVYHFLAGTYSAALPSSLAQDVLRTVMVTKQVGHGVGWGAAWANRIIGLAAWLVLCLCGLAFVERRLLPQGTTGVLAVVLMLMLLAVSVSFSKCATRPVRILLSRVVPASALAVMSAVRETVYQYRGKKATVLRLIVIALGIELCAVVCPAVAVYGISGTFPVAAFLFFIPLIEILVIALPLTFGGLGLRELLAATLLAQLGLTAEQTGLYVSLGFLGALVKAAGGIPFIVFRSRRAPGIEGSPSGDSAPPAQD